MSLGLVAVDCPECPWPVHLSLLADPDRPVREGGTPYALDAERAGVLRALEVHGVQHGWTVGGEE